MITGPAVFHQGYNRGYNIAEAVNFGIPSWKPFLKVTSSCYCLSRTWKIARPLLHQLADDSPDIKINSSVFKLVRSSKFLVIAETQSYQKVHDKLKALRLNTPKSDWIGLEPVPNESIKTFSIYSLRLFQVKCGKPILLPALKKKRKYISKKQKLNEPQARIQSNLNDQIDNAIEEDYDERERVEELNVVEEQLQTSETIPMSKFTTLNHLYTSFNVLLQDCFILPFTTGKILVSESGWSDTFQMKWSTLQKICLEYNWNEVFRNLKKPICSSPPQQGSQEFFTYQQIQDNFNAEDDRERVYFSLSLKVQSFGGGNSIEVAVVDNKGHLRLHSILDRTKSSKEAFWKNFKLLTNSFGEFSLIIPNKRLLKFLLLIPKDVEDKVNVYYEMATQDEEEGNQAFVQSIFSIKKNHNYFRYLDLEGNKIKQFSLIIHL